MMKTRQLFLTTCLLAGVLIYSGCKKAELNDLKESNEVAEAPDFENPLSAFGQAHNDALDAIAAHPDFPNLTFFEKGAIAEDVIVTLSPSGIIEITTLEAFDLLQNQFDPDKSLSDYTQEFLDDGTITPKQKVLFDHLNVIIETSQSLNELHTRLTTFDNNLNVRDDISAEEKQFLLGTSTILRFSSQFWEDALADPTNPWNPIISGDIPPDPDPIPSLFRAIKDAIGYVLGFVGCDCSGIDDRHIAGTLVGGEFSG